MWEPHDSGSAASGLAATVYAVPKGFDLDKKTRLLFCDGGLVTSIQDKTTSDGSGASTPTNRHQPLRMAGNLTSIDRLQN